MSRNPENVRERAHKYLEGGLAGGGNSTHLTFKIQKEINRCGLGRAGEEGVVEGELTSSQFLPVGRRTCFFPGPKVQSPSERWIHSGSGSFSQTSHRWPWSIRTWRPQCAPQGCGERWREEGRPGRRERSRVSQSNSPPAKTTSQGPGSSQPHGVKPLPASPSRGAMSLLTSG